MFSFPIKFYDVSFIILYSGSLKKLQTVLGPVQRQKKVSLWPTQVTVKSGQTQGERGKTAKFFIIKLCIQARNESKSGPSLHIYLSAYAVHLKI